jgi:hypothetical protein
MTSCANDAPYYLKEIGKGIGAGLNGSLFVRKGIAIPVTFFKEG